MDNLYFRIHRLLIRQKLMITIAEVSYLNAWNWLPQADTNNNGIIDAEDVEKVWKHVIRNYKQLTTKQKNTTEALTTYKPRTQQRNETCELNLASFTGPIKSAHISVEKFHLPS